MRVLITGATGTIGQGVADALRARGDQVVAVSRNLVHGRTALGPDAEVHAWPDPTTAPPPPESLRVDAIVHLIGERIDQRWTDEAKRRIHDSRVLSTRQLVAGVTALPADERPAVLVSQSAVGYYGDRGDTRIDEAAPAGSDWLASVVVAWRTRRSRPPTCSGSRSRGPASCSRPAAAPWPRCSPSSNSASAGRSPAASSMSPGST